MATNQFLPKETSIIMEEGMIEKIKTPLTIIKTQSTGRKRERTSLTLHMHQSLGDHLLHIIVVDLEGTWKWIVGRDWMIWNLQGFKRKAKMREKLERGATFKKYKMKTLNIRKGCTT